MWKKYVLAQITFILMFCSYPLWAGYGSQICRLQQYTCLKVLRGENWLNLFPDPQEREIVKKVNRMNTPLQTGMVIAVPRNLRSGDVMEYAPFPQRIENGSKLVKVDLSELAWGAYEGGSLVNWGPISGGRNYCPDVKRGCKTVTGSYTFYNKQGPGCISSKFPLPRGGAPMPYCMHFYKGFALHGSPTVPGYNASHGCVRLFTEDARWLNQDFINVGTTRVIISN